MKYNSRLTCKAIIRVEQMLRKPFSAIDYSDETDLLTVLYCSVLVNNPERMTLDDFTELTKNGKQLSTMLREIEKDNAITNQFLQPQGEGETGESSEAVYLKDIVASLILAGLDATYAMDAMTLADLPLFVDAYEKKKREEMEAARHWTFLSVAPHIDTKKIRNPMDFYTFPWEVEEKRKKAIKEMEDNTETFNRFMSGEFNRLLKS